MMIFFYSYCLTLCAAFPNISVSSGSNATLTCKLNGTFTLPEWLGPPNLTIYNHQGDRLFNPAVPVVVENRLDWTNDDINLVIRSVTQSDSGRYRCYHTNTTYYMVDLVVILEDTTSHGSTTGVNTTSPENTIRPEPKQITGAAVAGIVTAVVVTFCTMVMLCVWRKRKTLMKKCCRQKPQINQDILAMTVKEKALLVDVQNIHGDRHGITASEEALFVDVDCMHGVTDIHGMTAMEGALLVDVQNIHGVTDIHGTTAKEKALLVDVQNIHGDIYGTTASEKAQFVDVHCMHGVLQQDLISYYRKEFSKLQLSPLIDEEGYAADFFDCYVKPNITILSHQRSKGQSKSTPVTFHDIFNCKPCQNIYVSSPAGCGKTSFAKYLALTWCQAHLPVESYNQWILKGDIDEMRTFMFLFIIFLRDVHERECDVDIMIENQLLPNLANSTIYTELGVKFLQNLLSNQKCIIVLDGLDEWSHPAGDMCKLKNKHIPHSRARPFCTTLTTSRPWKLDVVKFKPKEMDQKLELNSLGNDLLEHLISKVVYKLNELHGKNKRAVDFEQELDNKKLTDLSSIPVVLMQLLTVWFDNEPLGESHCEIFSNMIEFLLKRYCKMTEIVSVMEDIEVSDCSRDRQIPKCLQKNMYCKDHLELLSKLAILAYNTLFTDCRESSLVFDRRIAKKYLTDKEIEMSLAVGILTQEKVLGKISIRQSHISFIHKTFQEYLAALYVALSPGMVKNVEDKIKHVCCSIEKILEMSQIFMFLSGLCPELLINLYEHLRQTVSEDSRTQKYRASCELDLGSSEGETLVRVQDTMLECLGESWSNGHQHVTHLPVSDFFILYPSGWSAELYSLTIHNPVCSLYVCGDDSLEKIGDVYRGDSLEKIEDILNSVSVFNSIQKVWFANVSDTLVVQLVSQHKHCLSVRSDTWRHLKCVTFRLVDNIPGDSLYSLVDSILQLPKSVLVRLEDCSIRQGIEDWAAYIWSNPRVTVDVGDRIRTNDNLLQFHTNNV